MSSRFDADNNLWNAVSGYKDDYYAWCKSTPAAPNERRIRMKFKEFVNWCNHRAADGCWGMETAIVCINIIGEIRKFPFWRREKEWQSVNSVLKIVENVVEPINQKIQELTGENE